MNGMNATKDAQTRTPLGSVNRNAIARKTSATGGRMDMIALVGVKRVGATRRRAECVVEK